MPRKKRAAQLNHFLRSPSAALTPGAKVAVIGAGLAGSAAAHALAHAGAEVTVFEREQNVASQTSGHPAAVVFPMIGKMAAPLRDFYGAGYGAILKKLATLKRDHGFNGWRQTGAYHLLVNDRLTHLWDQFDEMDMPRDWVQRLTAAEMARETEGFLSRPAFAYPTAGYVDPPALVKAFLEHSSITTQTHREVLQLKPHSQGWVISFADKSFEAQAVVLACGLDVLRFPFTAWLPLRCFRGQMAFIPAESARPLSQKVLCHEGYLVPHCGQGHLAGATFHPSDRDAQLKTASHEALLGQLKRWLPGLLKEDPEMAGRVAFRAQAPDHLPMVGPVPMKERTEETFRWLRLGQAPEKDTVLPCHPHLYVSIGHASRGTVSCWLAGMVIASQIMGVPAPIADPLLSAIHPGRFLLRALRRDQLLPNQAIALDDLPPRLQK